jgi:RNA polymerase sigma factor (TIGR02999 family)
MEQMDDKNVSPTGVTELLINWNKGDREALDEMLPLVYDELRRIAARCMKREKSEHTLQPTALVHEAYMRLVDQRQVDWKNRAQFFGLAAEMMRRILVNHAVQKQTSKRGGEALRVSLSDANELSTSSDTNLVALDEALTRFSEVDSRKSRIVELKFFGGLTTNEIAEVLQVSVATVEREWSLARAWLFREINTEGVKG